MRAFSFRVGEGYLSHILYGGSSISSEMQILLFDPAGEKEGVLKCYNWCFKFKILLC